MEICPDVTGDLTYDEATAKIGMLTGIATVGNCILYAIQYTTSARDAGTFNEGANDLLIQQLKKLWIFIMEHSPWTKLPGMTLGLTVALDG